MQKILGIFVLATMLAVPVVASAASQVPAGFIALSESPMNWADAKAFCQQKGGKLPLIGGSTKRGDAPKGTSIKGFGTVDGSWPDDLPDETYWIGTEHSSRPGDSWFVFALDGNVTAYNEDKSAAYLVACVP